MALLSLIKLGCSFPGLALLKTSNQQKELLVFYGTNGYEASS